MHTASTAAPLTWEEPATRTNGCWVAQTPLGPYSVGFDDGWHASLDEGIRWEWEPDEDPRSYHGPHAAMAACQAHVQSIVDSLVGAKPASTAMASPVNDETRIAVDAAKDTLRLVGRIPEKVGRSLAKRAEDALIQLNFVFPSDDVGQRLG